MSKEKNKEFKSNSPTLSTYQKKLLPNIPSEILMTIMAMSRNSINLQSPLVVKNHKPFSIPVLKEIFS